MVKKLEYVSSTCSRTVSPAVFRTAKSIGVSHLDPGFCIVPSVYPFWRRSLFHYRSEGPVFFSPLLFCENALLTPSPPCPKARAFLPLRQGVSDSYLLREGEVGFVQIRRFFCLSREAALRIACVSFPCPVIGPSFFELYPRPRSPSSFLVL